MDTHTKLMTDLQEQAKSAGVDVPSTASTDGKEMCGKLMHLRGRALDKEFVSEMISFHQTELTNFKNEAESGKDMQMLKLAQNMVPMIQQHLDDLQGIQKNVL